MKIMIEFYRTRNNDDAHAIVGRATDEAVDRKDAIAVGRSLSLTLTMPQRPDAMTITDSNGNTLYSEILNSADRWMEATNMNAQNREIHHKWDADAIGVWENEGGALGGNSVDHHYGRRVEMDRSWTVYHVFSGVPATRRGSPMTGLSLSDATDGMLSLNLRRSGRRIERDRRLPCDTQNPETETAGS